MRVEPRQEKPVPAEALSFEAFFRDTYPRLAQALLLLVGGEGDAEDLAQEAMVRVYERWERVGGMDSPEGYVYRTALNLARKRARWATVRARLPLPRQDATADPAAVLEPRQEALRLLARLPLGQREALVLVGWLGLDADQAGRVLGIDAASVRGRIHRARASLRKEGDRHG